MKTMQTKPQKNRIFILVLFLAAIVFYAPSAYAQNSLSVEFENDPLFSESNFIPGSEVSKWVKVQNNTDFSQDVLVEAINIQDNDGFGGALNLTIKEGVVELYSGTLSDFFNEGEIHLSTLGAGGGTQYGFSVVFGEPAGNEHQESTLGFDILIGFRGDGSPLPEDEKENGGGGGGRGGGGQVIVPRGLVIINESFVVTEVSTTTAVVSWATSHKSTSRVIYDTVAGGFDFSTPPNYGYSFSTIELDTPAQPNGVTYHTVILAGLSPNTTYYYRAISHASPPSISGERSFTTLAYGEEESFDGVGGEGSSEGSSKEQTSSTVPGLDDLNGADNAGQTGDRTDGNSFEASETEDLESDGFSASTSEDGEAASFSEGGDNSTTNHAATVNGNGFAEKLAGKYMKISGVALMFFALLVLGARKFLRRQKEGL